MTSRKRVRGEKKRARKRNKIAEQTPLTDKVRERNAVPENVIELLRTVRGKDNWLESQYEKDKAAKELMTMDGIAGMLTESLKHEDPRIRGGAAKVLLKMMDKSTFDALIDALEDSDLHVCNNAAEALGKMGDKKAIPALISAVERGKGYFAIMALGELGDTSVIPFLVTTIEKGDTETRDSVAMAISKIAGKNDGDPLLLQAVPELRKALKETGTSGSAAACALSKIADPSAIRDLTDAIALAPRDDAMCCFAGSALEKMSEMAIPELMTRMGSPEEYIRNGAYEGLRRIGPKAIPALSKAILEDRRAVVRLNAASIIGDVGDMSGVSVLARALNDRDKFMRMSALVALREIAEQNPEKKDEIAAEIGKNTPPREQLLNDVATLELMYSLP